MCKTLVNDGAHDSAFSLLHSVAFFIFNINLNDGLGRRCGVDYTAGSKLMQTQSLSWLQLYSVINYLWLIGEAGMSEDRIFFPEDELLCLTLLPQSW